MLFVFIRSFNGAIKRSIFRGHATPGLVIGAVKDKKGSRKTRELVNNSARIFLLGACLFQLVLYSLTTTMDFDHVVLFTS
jgi:hypothetical protein